MWPEIAEGSDIRVLHVANLNQLRAVNCRFVLRNDGTENIDALRIEVGPDLISMHYPENGREKEFLTLREWMHRPSMQFDVPLTSIVHPGDKIQVRLTRYIVEQFLHAQSMLPPGKPCIAKVTLKWYGRLAGYPNFDNEGRMPGAAVGFRWERSGFPEAECNEFLKNTPPRAEILGKYGGGSGQGGQFGDSFFAEPCRAVKTLASTPHLCQSAG
jgi:hypothetical protein